VLAYQCPLRARSGRAGANAALTVCAENLHRGPRYSGVAPSRSSNQHVGHQWLAPRGQPCRRGGFVTRPDCSSNRLQESSRRGEALLRPREQSAGWQTAPLRLCRHTLRPDISFRNRGGADPDKYNVIYMSHHQRVKRSRATDCKKAEAGRARLPEGARPLVLVSFLCQRKGCGTGAAPEAGTPRLSAPRQAGTPHAGAPASFRPGPWRAHAPDARNPVEVPTDPAEKGTGRHCGARPCRRAEKLGTDMKRNIFFTVLLGLLAFGFYELNSRGVSLGVVSQKPGEYERTYAALLTVVCAILAAYQLVVVGIRTAVSLGRRVPGEVQMLTGLVRVGAGVAVLIVILGSLGRLTAVGAVVAGFAGLLLGWSLQAPVSGIAAWAMITVKRPFRVGDRVLLPSLGLNGDVMDVGLMYTSLNQVGGSIASEEAIGRHILIPNAMLFTQVVINYTPEMGAEGSAHFLDEVIVRITFDSDWNVAERILLDAAQEVTAPIIRETGTEPYIRSDMYDYGVYMRLRYMTLATDRPRITHEITKRVFRAFQRELRVDHAIPYVYSYRHTLPPQRFRYPSEDEGVEEINIVDIDEPWRPGSLSEAEEEAIKDLARHIETVGLLQPLVTERRPDGRYRVVAGTNRLRACKLLGWTRIPATVLGPKPPRDLT